MRSDSLQAQVPAKAEVLVAFQRGAGLHMARQVAEPRRMRLHWHSPSLPSSEYDMLHSRNNPSIRDLHTAKAMSAVKTGEPMLRDVKF
jgi:hypothetical protein